MGHDKGELERDELRRPEIAEAHTLKDEAKEGQELLRSQVFDLSAEVVRLERELAEAPGKERERWYTEAYRWAEVRNKMGHVEAAIVMERFADCMKGDALTERDKMRAMPDEPPS